jgi:hypothetical protein
MKITFGIITGNGGQQINKIIDSIEKQNIPEYEIIIVGDCDITRDNTRNISFDESVKHAWITRKKNLITENAEFDNIVYLHDYVVFEDKWYEGQLKSGEDFFIRMDKIKDIDGDRYYDWIVWRWNNNFMDSIIAHGMGEPFLPWFGLIPYTMTHLSKYMYISGMYWIAKKHVMEEFPLDENLVWGQGEDVEWSKRVREKYDFNMNPYSTVRIIKDGKGKSNAKPPTEEMMEKLLNINND